MKYTYEKVSRYVGWSKIPYDTCDHVIESRLSVCPEKPDLNKMMDYCVKCQFPLGESKK